MKIRNIILSLALTAMAAGITLADNTNLPKVAINGKQYYYYEVRKDDSLYGIAKQFGWDADVLAAENPRSASELIKGSKLYYPVETSEDNAASASGQDTSLPQPVAHVVKKGETVYALALKYGVTTEAIYEANPGSEKGIKAGQSLIIPATRNTETAAETKPAYPPRPSTKVVERESVTAQAVETTPEQTPFTPVTPEKIETLQVVSTDDMPVVSVENMQQKQYDSVKISVVMAQPKSKKDLEFVRGMLVGIDEYKNNGKKISFKVIDGRAESQAVADTLKAYNPDLIITTSENVPAYLANIGNELDATVINVFDVKSELYKTSPSVVHMMTPSVFFNEETSDYIADRYEGAKMIILGEEDPNDAILEILRYKFSGNTLKSTAEDLKTMPLEDGVNYLIYATGTKLADAKEAIEVANDMCGRTVFSKYAIMMRPNLVLQDKELREADCLVDIYVPSRYYYDEQAEGSKKFNEKFTAMFNHHPQKAFPIYAVEGYDTINYFLPAYFANQGDFKKGYTDNNVLQSGVYLYSITPESGLVNTFCYMLRYAGGLNDMEKIELSKF